MEAKTNELIIFDFGQVIVRLDWERALTTWGAASGLDRDTLAACLQSDDLFLRFESGDLSDDAFIAHGCRKFGLGNNDSAFVTGWNAIFCEPFAATVSAIETLNRHKGRRRAVVLSNTNAIHEKYFRVKYATVVSLFDRLYLSHKLGSRKPAAQCFESVMSAEGVVANQCLFFDDLDTNISAAKALGIEAVLVKSSHNVTSVLEGLD